MISAVAKDEEVHLTELMEVLKESQKYIQLNSELKRKTIELRQANDAIEKANRNLQELDDRKNDFLTTVTHELRTPITSIRAFSEILFDNPELELEERQHFLQIITRETDRLSRLISQVLDLEKYESGKQELNLSQFFITDLITEVAQSFQSQLLEKYLFYALVQNSLCC
jgi:signal transduction histidine kinase